MKITTKNNKVTIDGRDFVGRDVVIKGDKVFVDGVEQSGSLVGPISITVMGDAEHIETGSGDVTVQGACRKVNTMSGDVTVHGDVTGGVETMSGDVECGSVTGGVRTVSGDITSRGRA